MAEKTDIPKAEGKSLDIDAVDKEKLKSVFPQCFNENKLDIDKLLSLCGEYIDNDFEKYKFEWKGKSECYRIAGQRSTGTLRPEPKESVDFENTNNLYIEGDNLEVLKLLQASYYRKVKMIYIDPPYNTGHDFVYEDDFKDPIAKYKEVTAQTTKSNPETMGRYHTNWLNMMYPRLRLAANLLRDDGVIFISIDDNEQANLKKLCDEVFGEENFIDSVVWEKRYSPQNAVQWFSESHDFILVYAKRKEEWHPNLLERTEDMNARYRNLDNDPRGDWKPTDATAQGGHGTGSQFYTLKAPNGKEHTLSPGRCWIYTEKVMNEMIADNRVWFGTDGNNVPAIKRFLTEVKQGTACKTIWNYEEVGHNQEGKKEIISLFNSAPFETLKPVRLIKRILQLSTNSKDNDIILDFFSGSATTAHAVMQLNAEDGGNRQFIMVQLPEACPEGSYYKNLCEIDKERIRRAGAKIKAEQKQPNLIDATEGNVLDVGFKVLKLDSSNLEKWDSTPVEEAGLFARLNAMDKSLKTGRTDLGVVYEVMLKLGISLTYAVKELKVNNRKVYSVGDDSLILVCIDGSNGGITPEDVTAMCEYTPAKIVAAEEAFKDDVVLSNAYYISKDNGITVELL